MAEPSKFSGLLQQMGILSPSEQAAQQYQNQLQQLQAMQMTQQVANQGASRYGLFGGPVAQAEARRMGNPSSFKIPELPQAENTQPAQQIMQGAMQSGASQSSQLYKASQDFLKMGDTQRAYQAYAAAVQAAQLEQEEQRKQQELGLKLREDQRRQAELTKPENFGTVGVAGNPKGRQVLNRTYNEATGQWELTPEGHSYEVSGGDTNVNLGSLLTDAQAGDEVRKLADKVTAARGFTRLIGSVREQLQKGGKTGIPQQVFSFVDEVISTAKHVIVDPDVSGYAAELLSDGRWQEKMKATHISQSQLIQLAYQRAKMFDQDGRIAKDDFKNALDQLGARLSNPEAVLSVLLENAGQSIREIEEAYERTGAITKIPDGLKDLKGKLSQEYAELTKGSNDIPEDTAISKNPPGVPADWVELAPGIYGPKLN